MNSTLIRILIYVLVFVIIQIPMLHGWVLFDQAFPFQYIGLILLLPHRLTKSAVLWIAFALGLIIDLFSNTPGLHASASVFIAFIRLSWLGVVDDTSEEELDLTTAVLGVRRFTFYIFPLIFLHHALVFILENEGLRWFWMLLGKIFWSSLYSFVIILIVALYVAPRGRRL